MKKFVEGNFSLMLLMGAILGFFLPSVGESADKIVIVLTAILIFISCSDIEPHDFLKTDIFQMGVFVLLRFIILPILLFAVFQKFFLEYSIGVLLLALMPAGVAVAALCSLSRANVVLGISLTIMTSFMAPFVIPAVFSFWGHEVNVDIVDLFFTLLLIVAVPIFSYFLILRRSKACHFFVKNNNKVFPTLILAVILAIVIASQKEALLADINIVYTGIVLMFVLFFIFYGFGVLYAHFMPPLDKVPYIYGSGAMNNSLAVGLAFAYFDSTTVIFIVLSEIVWTFYIAVAQYVFLKRNNN